MSSQKTDAEWNDGLTQKSLFPAMEQEADLLGDLIKAGRKSLSVTCNTGYISPCGYENYPNVSLSFKTLGDAHDFLNAIVAIGKEGMRVYGVHKDEIYIDVQLDGKKITHIRVPKDWSPKEIEDHARRVETVQMFLTKKEVVKVIVVPHKLINFVTKVKTCGYIIPWVGPCKNEEPCSEHSEQLCTKCKVAKATHGCSNAGSLVCGRPLCDDCSCIHSR